MTKNVIVDSRNTTTRILESEPEFLVGHGETRILTAVHTYARSYYPNEKVYVCMKNTGDINDLPEEFKEEYRDIVKYGIFNGVIVHDDNIVVVKNALAVHLAGVDHVITPDREWVLK